MITHEISLTVPSSATTQTISVSTSSAQTAAIYADSAVVVATDLVFVVFGDSPTATTSCMPLVGGVAYRLTGWKPGQKLAFIAGGSCTAYVTPGA